MVVVGGVVWENEVVSCIEAASYIRERSSITSARLGGVGGLSQNADTADALEGGGGV